MAGTTKMDKIQVKMIPTRPPAISIRRFKNNSAGSKILGLYVSTR